MNKSRTLVYTGLMIALVAIGTILIRIPSPKSGGYLNLGDGIINLSSFLFGPYVGMISGGIGSALADIIGGYSHYALFSLVIKGAMGFCVGYSQRIAKGLNKTTILALVISELIMVFGYYLANMFFSGTVMVGLASIPADAIQGVFGMALFLVVTKTLNLESLQQKLER
ncbi:ECF transporter S component [Lagierella sp.]|uniref:ECF transporter S component n=1 Tax=Lagierella sp. TaxID=2849657 RepID=UPI00260FA41A|nr:ECF transporter S component [Lagierella sp.]